jgi:hypothetical protein
MQVTIEEKTEGPSVESNLERDNCSSEDDDNDDIEEMKVRPKTNIADAGIANTSTRWWTYAVACILLTVGSLLSVSIFLAFHNDGTTNSNEEVSSLLVPTFKTLHRGRCHNFYF